MPRIIMRDERGRIVSVGRNPVEERFWEKVDRKGDDECWEWTAGRAAFGYGRLEIRKRDDSGWTDELAHRLSWEFANGPIPDGLWVLHHCDNPPCCNPAHLFLGTAGTNARDMVSKGRAAAFGRRGERNPRAKLTAQDVLRIRARAPNETQRALAAEFGVAPETIRRILRRHTWTDI